MLPPSPIRAGVLILAFTALLYLITLVNLVFFHGWLDRFGIEPRQVSGLVGVVVAPLLHAGWAHLLGNTVPVLVFGYLAMAAGIGPWVATTVLIWLVSGFGVWLTGFGDTIGASGIAFGWLAFLLVRGVFNRSAAQLLVAVVLLLFWGTSLLGVLPGLDPRISWQAHAFGALGGVLAAWLNATANRARARRASATAAPAPLDSAPPGDEPPPGEPGGGSSAIIGGS